MTIKKIRKEAFSLYKHNLSTNIVMSFGFVLICVLCLLLYLAFAPSILLTIPFIAIPFLFCLYIGISSSKTGAKLSNKTFYKAYPFYFKKPLYGSFRVIVSFFKSFLVYLVFFGIVYICFYFLNPSFSALINELSQLKFSSMDELVQFISSNESTLLPFYRLEYIVGFGLMFLLFIFFIGRNFTFVSLCLTMLGAPKTVVLYLFKTTMKKIRWKYERLFWGSNWFVILISLLGYALGAGLVWINSTNYFLAFFVGASTSLLALAILLPYYIHCQDLIFGELFLDFLSQTFSESKNNLDSIKDNKDISEEDKIKMANIIDEQEKEIDRLKEEKNKSNDGDKKEK